MRYFVIIVFSIFMILFTVACSSTEKEVSLPEMITPHENKYSVMIILDESQKRDEWKDVLHEFIEKDIVQIVNWGGKQSPLGEQVIEQYNIEIDNVPIALVFDHDSFVYKTYNTKELRIYLAKKVKHSSYSPPSNT